MERLKPIQPVEAIWVPGTQINIKEQDRRVITRRKRIGTIEEKLSYLQKIPKDLLYEDLAMMISELESLYPFYQDTKSRKRIKGYQEAAMTEETMVSTFGEKLSYLIPERGSEIYETVRLISENLATSEGNKVFLSMHHTFTYFLIDEAIKARKEEEKDPNVAVIVFDNHPDVFIHPGPKKISESTVFLSLIGNGIIPRVAFLGPVTFSAVVQRAIDLLDQYDENHSRDFIRLIPPENLTSKNPDRVDRDLLRKEIIELISTYKEEGITNVVFSIDIDILNAKKVGYTGFQYNPMELFDVLAKTTPYEVDPLEVTEGDIIWIYGDLLAGWRKLMNIKRRYEGDEFFKKIQEFLDTGYKNNSILQNIRNKNFDPNLFNLGDLGVALDTIFEECRKQGLEYGIALKGGGRYLGDIAGIEGVDYKGFTARAARALIERMENPHI
jgi:hypothetical protein